MLKRNNHTLYTSFAALLLIPLLFSSCRKLVEPNHATQYVTTEGTFATADAATSAVYGMYDKMRPIVVGRYTIDLSNLSALSSDEHIFTSASTTFQPFYLHAVEAGNSLNSTLWEIPYQLIYTANAVIEGVEKHGKNLPDTLRKQFTGEAKFLRAWAHFVLVNLYGDVPLILTTDYAVNRLPARSPQAAVYQQIVSDLLSARDLVLPFYLDRLNSINQLERVRTNKYVVTAFLSKVYLYMGEWQKAEAMASEVLAQTTTYSLNPNFTKDAAFTSVFDNKSNENILQVFESQFFAGNTYDLTYTTDLSGRFGRLSDSVVNKFEAGDKRREEWIGTRTVGPDTWHYVSKLRSTYPTHPGGDQWVPAMRLAELYLIRAEARIQQNQLAAGIGDLNKLRQRARAAATTAIPNPLPDLTLALSKTEAMLALEKEWTREMFMEGHRWFNLKRWKGINNPGISRADELMPSIVAAKGVTWQSYMKLFPIPLFDLERNPNLVQNPGY